VKHKRSSGLLAIIIYKSFVAVLLGITSIALLLALKHRQELANFSESYILETKLKIIEFIINAILNINPNKLKFTGIVMGVYAIVTAIEAVGLWYEKSWARLLVLGLVGISIPPEIFELIKQITIPKFLVILVNVAVFWYLLQHFPKQKN
jgi:uncharacterized membrane protein (DUF2068 family)